MAKKAAKKKAEVEEAPVVHIKTGMPVNSDITISLSVKTPDGETHEDSVVIKSAGGCIPIAYLNNPHRIIKSVKEGLRNKYGANHVKV